MDLLITRASEIVTFQGSDAPLRGDALSRPTVIPDGSLWIQNGMIAATGSSEEVQKKLSGKRPTRQIDASGKVVIPGLVDPHTHLLFAGSRKEEFLLRAQGLSYLEIAARGGGILKTVAETRKTPKEELITLGLQRLDEFLTQGTTTVEIKSGYGLDPESEIKMLEAIAAIGEKHLATVVSTFLGAHAFPREFVDHHQGYITQIIEAMLPEISNRQLAEFCDVFCEKGAFTERESRLILRAAKEMGLAIKVHADELSGSGGSRLAIELKAISAEHLCFTEEKDLKNLAESGTIAVLLPTTPFLLMAPRYADARKMIDLGVPIALGSDYNPTSSISSMLLVISLACLNMRLNPAEALAAATINAAQAIDRSKEVGSLEMGKMADLLILDIPTYREIPFNIGKDIIHTVIKKGRIIRSEES